MVIMKFNQKFIECFYIELPK